MDQKDIVEELSRLADQNAQLADQNARFEAELSRLREERIPAVDRSSRRRDRRLTIAYVAAAALAVGLAGVGSASALDGSNTVFSDDIVDGTLTSLDVAKNTLITSDIKDNSIAGRDLQDGTITGADVADGNITSIDVQDKSITGGDIAYDSITGFEVAGGTIDGYNIANSSLDDRDIADGSLTGLDVKDGTVAGADIADGSINGNDIDLFNDNRCTLETLLGTALINADPAVPSTYTTAWIGYPHSCSGGTVRVRRAGAGNYVVDFGTSNPARLAVVTENTANGAIASTVISVESFSPGVFYVQTRNINGSFADVDFTIMVF